MSYLDVPRIHFGGLFYTDPNTMNNYIPYYDPSVNLKQPDGTYIVDLPTGGKNWSPTGVAQLWLENCRVLSAVGPDGKSYCQPSDDLLIGASVESPSPNMPQSDGGNGYRDLAKMVDIDPDQQGRSEIFGLWVYIKTSDGGGFHALWDRPNLHFACFHGNGGFDGYMQALGGSWQAQLINVQWESNTSSLLKELQKQSPNSLEMKLSVDLFQRDRTKALDDSGKGNRFGYGRLMGTIGPSGGDTAPSQVVPGRMLLTPPKAAPAPPAPTPLAPASSLIRDLKLGSVESANPAIPWSTAPFVTRPVNGKTFLIVDLGNSIPLSSDGRGKLDSPSPITFEPAGGSAFKNGTITIDDSSYVQINEALEQKNSFWLKNSGVYQFELTAAEASGILNSPVAAKVGNSTMLSESEDGYFLSVERPVLRLEPSSGDGSAKLWIYKFGAAVKSWPSDVQFQLQPQVLLWSNPPTDQDPVPTNTSDFSVLVNSTSVTGCFSLSIKTGPAVSLPPMRTPLDSQMYQIAITPDRTAEMTHLPGVPVLVNIGGAPLSLLFWQNHWVVKNPTWKEIGAILSAYARLYPGMKGKLDIGDKPTVIGFAQQIMEFMAYDFEDPAYMPVVRDLSPAVVSMVLDWLQAPN